MILKYNGNSISSIGRYFLEYKPKDFLCQDPNNSKEYVHKVIEDVNKKYLESLYPDLYKYIEKTDGFDYALRVNLDYIDSDDTLKKMIRDAKELYKHRFILKRIDYKWWITAVLTLCGIVVGYLAAG